MHLFFRAAEFAVCRYGCFEKTSSKVSALVLIPRVRSLCRMRPLTVAFSNPQKCKVHSTVHYKEHILCTHRILSLHRYASTSTEHYREHILCIECVHLLNKHSMHRMCSLVHLLNTIENTFYVIECVFYLGEHTVHYKEHISCSHGMCSLHSNASTPTVHYTEYVREFLCACGEGSRDGCVECVLYIE